jgi:hypothetical protein
MIESTFTNYSDSVSSYFLHQNNSPKRKKGTRLRKQVLRTKLGLAASPPPPQRVATPPLTFSLHFSYLRLHSPQLSSAQFHGRFGSIHKGQASLALTRPQPLYSHTPLAASPSPSVPPPPLHSLQCRLGSSLANRPAAEERQTKQHSWG